jgi:hypothetical protein
VLKELLSVYPYRISVLQLLFWQVTTFPLEYEFQYWFTSLTKLPATIVCSSVNLGHTSWFDILQCDASCYGMLWLHQLPHLNYLSKQDQLIYRFCYQFFLTFSLNLLPFFYLRALESIEDFPTVVLECSFVTISQETLPGDLCSCHGEYKPEARRRISRQRCGSSPARGKRLALILLGVIVWLLTTSWLCTISV